MSIRGRGFACRERSGKLLILRLTPRGVRRLRLETSPHASPRAAPVWMKRLLDDPKTDDVERAHLRDAVNQLNALLAPPPSTPDGQ
jgi:hypothetical protein